MEFITTVTQKGQVTIPKKMRDDLGIKNNNKVKVEKKEGYLKITPTFDLLDIAGTIKPRKNAGIDPVKAREYMETHYERV